MTAICSAGISTPPDGHVDARSSTTGDFSKVEVTGLFGEFIERATHVQESAESEPHDVRDGSTTEDEAG